MAKYLDLSGLSTLWGKVTSKFLRYDAAQTLATAQQEQARKNISAGGSNYNILDNSWFLVNSRRQTSYASEGYTADRWKMVNGCTVNVVSNGIRFISSQTYRSVRQLIATPSRYANGTYTVSVNIASIASSPSYLIVYDGNSAELLRADIGSEVGIKSWTFTSNASGISAVLFDCLTRSSVDFTITAVKLEHGTVSTLANDTPPDYGEELTRCIYSTADPTDPYANNGFGRTNPNLLDNPWFTVNQRQLPNGSMVSANSYGVDRWFGVGAGYKIDADGIILAGTMVQRWDDKAWLNGKTVTYSALYADGTLAYGTGTFAQASYITMNDGGSVLIVNTGQGNFSVGEPTKVLRAVKLELGSVSTLANDLPPNYAEELAKCQRYFNRISFGSTNYPIAYGYAYSATAVRYLIPLPVTMRTTPTLALTNSFLALGTNAGTNAVTAFTPVATFPNGVLVLGTTSNHTIGISILMTGANATLDLSADL